MIFQRTTNVSLVKMAYLTTIIFSRQKLPFCFPVPLKVIIGTQPDDLVASMKHHSEVHGGWHSLTQYHK